MFFAYFIFFCFFANWQKKFANFCIFLCIFKKIQPQGVASTRLPEETTAGRFQPAWIDFPAWDPGFRKRRVSRFRRGISTWSQGGGVQTPHCQGGTQDPHPYCLLLVHRLKGLDVNRFFLSLKVQTIARCNVHRQFASVLLHSDLENKPLPLQRCIVSDCICCSRNAR